MQYGEENGEVIMKKYSVPQLNICPNIYQTNGKNLVGVMIEYSC